MCSNSRTEGLFTTYGTADGLPVEHDGIKASLINHIKKRGPSYSQLQKKKKTKKKGDKRKQTFYEKVLSKTIGQPGVQGYDTGYAGGKSNQEIDNPFVRIDNKNMCDV